MRSRVGGFSRPLAHMIHRSLSCGVRVQPNMASVLRLLMLLAGLPGIAANNPAASAVAAGTSENSKAQQHVQRPFQRGSRVTIVYLITGVEYVAQLADSFPLLEQNWLARIHPMPSVTVFYTSDGLRQRMEAIGTLQARAAMVLINESQPTYARDLLAQGRCLCCCNNLKRRQRKQPAMRAGHFAHDYCFMNHFRTLLMYRHPALAAYDYFVQMDTDTYIRKPMTYDPVAHMRHLGGVWGYIKHEVRPTPADDCNDGLYEAIDAYYYGRLHHAHFLPSSPLLPVDHGRNATLPVGPPVYRPPRGTTYQGAFNIGDLRFLRSDVAINAFLRWINEQQTGIWTHRWGDQAFLPNAIGLSMPSTAVVRFADLIDNGVIVHESKSLGRTRFKPQGHDRRGAATK